MIDIYNYQLYRHIDSPGWKLGWTWGGDEVIWDSRGAEATELGNCSKFTGNIPHCCGRNPVMVDLLPGAPYNMQTKNCCRGGVLSSLVQDRSNCHSSFQLSIGTLGAGMPLNANNFTAPKPYNFSLGVPGYTCSDAALVPPTKYQTAGGRRKTQALCKWSQPWSLFSQYHHSIMQTFPWTILYSDMASELLLFPIQSFSSTPMLCFFVYLLQWDYSTMSCLQLWLPRIARGAKMCQVSVAESDSSCG